MSRSSSPLSPFPLICLVSLLWSLTALTAKGCLDDGPWLTMWLGSSSLAALSLRNDGPSATVSRQLPLFIFFLLLSNSCYILALTTLPVNLATVIFSIAPVFVYLMSICVLSLKHTPTKMLFVLLGILGVGISCSGSVITPSGKSGVLLMLVSAFSAASYKVAINLYHPKESAKFVRTLLSRIGFISLFTMWIPVLISGYWSSTGDHQRAISWVKNSLPKQMLHCVCVGKEERRQ